MPLYQYRCNNCSSEFEELRRRDEADEAIECPNCKGMDVKRKMPSSISGNTQGGGTSHSSSCG